ncbi:MAG TPA: CARDB domain-containing protein [Tepidisphaeraceae bacterium]|jgi:hypothetical protein|nr:CARDB domain-containing protein [Tepidisphaeraceae bacterium]
MFSRNRRRDHQSKPAQIAVIEPMEGRTYYAANPATVTLTVSAPSPTAVIAGLRVNDKISVSIANNDVVKAGGKANVALFLSTDSTLSNDDVQVQTPSKIGLNIAAGRNHTYKLNVKMFPQNLNGTFFVIAELTGNGVNPVLGSSTATISVEQAFIDLSGAVTKTPSAGHVGKHIPVSVEVTNSGNILAKGPVSVAFSVSATPDGASAVPLATIVHHISLKPGKSSVIHFNVPVALGSPTGNQYVVADVDPSDAFLDSNLANNMTVGQQPITFT